MPTTTLRATALAVASAALLLGGCSDDGSGSSGSSPEEVMASAKSALDDTSGVSISLTTDDLPEGVTAIKTATGVGTHDPAFEGSFTVVLSGTEFNVPIVAVDGKVYAQIPLTPGWSDVDPEDYGAPDPARLMSTDAGLSSLLTSTDDLEEGESVRGGENNDEVLTEYTGTVPGDAVGNVIPGASGDFDATYTVSDDGELREAVLTGVFYPGTDPMTYTLGFEDYGTDKDITAP